MVDWKVVGTHSGAAIGGAALIYVGTLIFGGQRASEPRKNVLEFSNRSGKIDYRLESEDVGTQVQRLFYLVEEKTGNRLRDTGKARALMAVDYNADFELAESETNAAVKQLAGELSDTVRKDYGLSVVGPSTPGIISPTATTKP